MGKVCFKNCVICCRYKDDIIYNELFIDNENYQKKDNIKKIIFIQSIIRRFLIKKRLISNNLFQIKEISIDYNTDSYKII